MLNNSEKLQGTSSYSAELKRLIEFIKVGANDLERVISSLFASPVAMD